MLTVSSLWKHQKSLFVVFADFCGKSFPTGPFQATEVTKYGIDRKCQIVLIGAIDMHDIRNVDSNKM